MTTLSLTPAECTELGCSREEALLLLARRARRLRKAMLAELEADLPKLRARAERPQSLNGVLVSVQRETSTATPSAPDDVAILLYGGETRGTTVGDVLLPKGRVLHYLARERFDEIAAEDEADGGIGRSEPCWERRLVFCREPHSDLVAMIRAGFRDPVHDTLKGRERFEWESETDSSRIAQFLADILRTTTDRELLEGWVAAAGDEQHAADIRARFNELFASSDPMFWGGKDDRRRGAAAAGHYNVGAKG